MKNHSVTAALLLGLTLSIGITATGYFVARTIYKIRLAERFVTVKGLAERSVAADLAIWPMTISATDGTLKDSQEELEKARDQIRAFLSEMGFEADEISESPPRVTDYYSQGLTTRDLPKNRYLVEMTLTVRSAQVQQVKAAMGKIGELLKEGVKLGNGYGPGAEFLFTGLNAIKPEMIAEATANARRAAEQFAKDSGSRVGAIRRARQGLFTITSRDMNTPEMKNVRVVTTIDYYLE